MSDLRRLIWCIKGSSVGGTGSWSNQVGLEPLEAEAIRLTSLFPDLEFGVETYEENNDD